MTVRNAQITDLPQLSILFDAYRVFYRKESDIVAASRFLKERLIKKDSELFVCENETSELVGFVQLYPLFSSTKMKRLWLLNDLYVDSNSRGNGISVKLIYRAKQLVKDSNACGMYLETEKSNTIGNSLYPRTGFELNNKSNYYEWSIK